MIKRTLFAALAALTMTVGTLSPATAAPQRISVTGEIIDTWCYVTEIMYAVGSTHHQCAVWCAVGGIPVSILGEDGNVYVVLRFEDEDSNVANPTAIQIQTHQVTVDGDYYERDGVKYLFVTQVKDDQGVVNLNQEDYGIQPFGE